jgi:hypothetical protein
MLGFAPGESKIRKDGQEARKNNPFPIRAQYQTSHS